MDQFNQPTFTHLLIDTQDTQIKDARINLIGQAMVWGLEQAVEFTLFRKINYAILIRFFDSNYLKFTYFLRSDGISDKREGYVNGSTAIYLEFASRGITAGFNPKRKV